MWGSGADRDPQNIWDLRKDCIGEKLRSLYRRNFNKLRYSITYTLIAFPLTPKHVTLNDHEWSFCAKFCFTRYVWSSEAWLWKLLAILLNL